MREDKSLGRRGRGGDGEEEERFRRWRGFFIEN
jgi:hypothetical protein